MAKTFYWAACCKCIWRCPTDFLPRTIDNLLLIGASLYLTFETSTASGPAVHDFSSP